MDKHNVSICISFQFNHTVNTPKKSNDWMTGNDDLGRMCKEAVVALFEAPISEFFCMH